MKKNSVIREKKAAGKFNYRRIMPVMLKEFLHIKRDARSLGIALLAPVVLLVLYGYAVTFDIKIIDLAVVDNDKTAVSRRLINSFTASGYFDINTAAISGTGGAVKEMKQNRARLILVIPEGLSSSLKKDKDVKVQLIADGSDSNTANVAVGYAKIIINTVSRNIMLESVEKRGISVKRMPAIEAVSRVWYNPELRSQNFIVPGLIAILMMLIAATLTSLSIVREKERGSFEQLISTPVKPLELMAGKLAPYILIGIVDVGIVAAAGILWFDVPFRGSFAAFLVFTVLFLFCSMGLGLFMSSAARSQTSAVIGTVFATMLPSILLSGFVFPIDSMPDIIKPVTYLVPAKYFLTALRSLFLKTDVGMSVLYPEAVLLTLFGALFLFLASKNFKKVLN